MIPDLSGLNPRMLDSMMKKMGITNKQMNAKRVIIELDDKKIIIEKPTVTEISMNGQRTFQVLGEIKEEKVTLDSDINLVSETAKIDKEKAKELLEKSEGDIAKAISLAKKD